MVGEIYTVVREEGTSDVEVVVGWVGGGAVFEVDCRRVEADGIL